MDEISGIAIVGMAGRFPKARTVAEFWDNLCKGKECITFFSREELEQNGIRKDLLDNPNYIRAYGSMEDIELFDAPFFGFNPLEAQVMDPQQRLFLECAWEALEHTGYNPDSFEGIIGVYSAIEMSTYLFNIFSNRDLIDSLGEFQIMLTNDKDFLPTRVSYKLNLKGPSINVQSACSSSLVAVHLACQSLLNGECDMVLAGGVSVRVPQNAGYLYQEDGIASPDGHCRAFDAKAKGTVGGSGLGVVVLKRLSDAIEDRDNIYAVIKGSAINNDGAGKIGYTAPSVIGQAQAIAEAAAVAGIDMNTISYVETHGTATPLGDPIEVEALRKAFMMDANPGVNKKHCAIGSVKTNVGHLSAAAGITGLIKTALSVKNKMLLPSINFEMPNPKIDFENSPFYVNTDLSVLKNPDGPVRAGVSSFGIGGTNAHVILEEAPPEEASGESRPWQLLVLSGKTDTAVDTMTEKLCEFFKENPGTNLADAAYTLKIGRQSFKYRRAVVCNSIEDARNKFARCDEREVLTSSNDTGLKEVAFMFPGQGAQFFNMAAELYGEEPVFRKMVDDCSRIVAGLSGINLIEELFSDSERKERPGRIFNPSLAQPALFVIEYALAHLFITWGIKPKSMIGYSVGEYVAACLSEVISLKDALFLVTRRGELMEHMPEGVMLAVTLSEKDVQPYLNERVSLASVNGPSMCVLSGEPEDMEELETVFAKEWLGTKRIGTTRAYHSIMTETILEDYYGEVGKVELNEPKIPFISNVTGNWIKPEEAKDPGYWVKHLRETVRFSDGINKMLTGSKVFLELGPGQTLCSFAALHTNDSNNYEIIPSMKSEHDTIPDQAFLLNALGKLWLAGFKIDWKVFYTLEKRNRIPLPTYPFEEQRYWIEMNPMANEFQAGSKALKKNVDISDWFYIPTFRHSPITYGFRKRGFSGNKMCWLVFSDNTGIADALVDKITSESQDVISVHKGNKYMKISDSSYIIDPKEQGNYEMLLEDIKCSGRVPDNVIHLWNVNCNPGFSRTSLKNFNDLQYMGFYSLLFLGKALAKHYIGNDINIKVVANGLCKVESRDSISPEKATLLGPCRVIPQEYPNIKCQCIDICINEIESFNIENFVIQILSEFLNRSDDNLISLRGTRRWIQTFEHISLENRHEQLCEFKEEGVYVITGGLGNMGLCIAEYLADTVKAKLILIGRSEFLPMNEWEDWLKDHEQQDTTCIVIKRLQHILELGSEITIASTSVGNEEKMREIINKTLVKYGMINGVIHAAGVTNAKTIQDMERQDCEKYFESKAYGLMVLEKVLQGLDLDFCLLMSSISSILGGLGFVAYSAANLFMDAFVEKLVGNSSFKWISINWDSWNFNGDGVKANTLGAELAALALSPDEGIRVIGSMLGNTTLGSVIVSTGDLKERFNKWVNIDRSQGSKSLYEKKRHSRPNLSVPYVGPSDDIEMAIADIWQEMLGIDKIGINDDFFEIGGHSLVALQIISRVRKAFNIELPIKDMFERPNIEGLAVIIKKMKYEDNSISD